MIQWWGYIHEDGSIHTKRYFDKGDLIEAAESPFVKRIFGPWSESKVSTKEQAIEEMKAEIGGKKREAEIMRRLWGYKK